MTKVCYERMFPDEFANALKKNPTAYLAVGSLEWHGYHNALGLDTLKAWKILQEVAQEVGGIVFPPIYLGLDLFPDQNPETHENKKYDCYHLAETQLHDLIKAYIEQMRLIGFKKVVLLAGHYPNLTPLQEMVKSFPELKIIVGRECDFINSDGDHAGKFETSLLMYLYPELVDLKQLTRRPLMAVNGEDPESSSEKYGQELFQGIVKGIIVALDQ